INPVKLEHVLRQIQTNRANLRHGRLPYLVESTTPVWHIDAVGGRPPHLCERSEAIHATACGDVDCFVASLLAMTRRRTTPCITSSSTAKPISTAGARRHGRWR